VNRIFRNLSLAAPVAAALLIASSSSVYAATATPAPIYPTEGGRTTLTLSKAFLADLTTAGATVTTLAGGQLDQNQAAFGITTGLINMDTAEGQMAHNGGLTITVGAKQATLDSFMLTTFGEQAYVSALVTANGHFVGRVNVFDVTLPSDLKLPITPKNGDFFLGLSWNLDPAGATALNDALDVTAFHDSVYVGYSSSLVLVPLAADPVPVATTTSK
jgi:hypothetical protein